MTDCKRCGIIILFENGLCFSQNGVPHDIRRCKTIPGYVWCPIHRAKFSKRHPCEHYVQYGYESDYKRLKRIREIGIELLDAGKKTRETNTPYHMIQKFHDFKFAIFGKEMSF